MCSFSSTKWCGRKDGTNCCKDGGYSISFSSTTEMANKSYLPCHLHFLLLARTSSQQTGTHLFCNKPILWVDKAHHHLVINTKCQFYWRQKKTGSSRVWTAGLLGGKPPWKPLNHTTPSRLCKFIIFLDPWKSYQKF